MEARYQWNVRLREIRKDIRISLSGFLILALADPHCSYRPTSPSLKGRWYAHINPTVNIHSCHFTPWQCKNQSLYVVMKFTIAFAVLFLSIPVYAQYMSLVAITTRTSSESKSVARTGVIPTSPAVPSSNFKLTRVNVGAVISVLLASLILFRLMLAQVVNWCTSLRTSLRAMTQTWRSFFPRTSCTTIVYLQFSCVSYVGT